MLPKPKDQRGYTSQEIKDICKEVERQLKHPEILHKERMEEIVEDGGYDIENPTLKIIEVIESCKI